MRYNRNMNSNEIPLPTTTPMAFPGVFTLEDMYAAAAELRNQGYTVNDPDSWTWPADAEDGNWHISVWR